MEIRYPNYYKKFHCIAGNCPDTCCAGWEISVDAGSEKRYREARKRGMITNRDFVRKLKKHVKHGRIISEDVTCPFLNRTGLCEMYIELGPDSLCNTCARYPRHLEDYGNLHEMVLLLSCPEVARLVLEENDGGFYVRQIPERQGNMDGIDEELLDVLLNARELIWKWATPQDGSYDANQEMSLEACMMCAVALAHDLQRRIAENDYAGSQMVVKRYDIPDVAEKFATQWTWKQKESGKLLKWSLLTDFMEDLTKLEIICKDWPEMMKRCQKRCSCLKQCFEKGNVNETMKIGSQGDRGERSEGKSDLWKIFQYFIYSFLLSALYDGDLLTKVKMAVLCTMAVEELFASEMIIPDLQRRAYICHAIARQIENSDENRARLESFLKQERFAARRIINALL